MPKTLSPLTLLCLASYEKGHRYLEQAKKVGCRVLLLTSESLKDTAKWPADSLDEIFYMPDVDHEWNQQHMLKGPIQKNLARTLTIPSCGITFCTSYNVWRVAVWRPRGNVRAGGRWRSSHINFMHMPHSDLSFCSSASASGLQSLGVHACVGLRARGRRV